MLFRRIDDETAATARLRVAQLSDPVAAGRDAAASPRHAAGDDFPSPDGDPPEWAGPDADRPSDPAQPAGSLDSAASAADDPEPGRLGRWVGSRVGRSVRLDPGRPGASALVVTALVAAVLAAVVTWLSRPSVEDVAPVAPAANSAPSPGPSSTGATSTGPASAGVPPAPGSTPPAPTDEIVVSVVGKVANPGLVTLPAGARVADALHAAGGALPGVATTTLNLARRLADGEQVAVGVPAAADPPPDAGAPASAAGAGTGAPTAPVNLNSATLDELDTLPGVGPVIAQRILDYRETTGPFRSTDQLQDVSGIGPATFEKLADLVTV